MGLFDLFRRGRGKANAPKQPRIDFLLQMLHDFLEKPDKAYDGGNFLQLVEKQLERGEVDLATWNMTSQVKYSFQLANLYWGQGDLTQAENWLRKTVERHERLVAACADYGVQRQGYAEIVCAKCAALLLDVGLAEFVPSAPFEPRYEPWFKNELLDYCLGTHPFDMNAWHNSADEWRKKRHPKYRMEEFSVYVKALTGQYGSTDEMLAAHQSMFAGRGRRNADGGLLEGYQDNELVIDHIFAAILKRIGWEGTYRHSWPNTDKAGSGWTTAKEPDRYLETIAARDPEPNPDTGIIDDPTAARRFIDLHVQTQRNEEDEPVDATRPAKDRSKVTAALKELGWVRDPAALDLMQSYRMDWILNDRTHIYLCDPLARKSIKLADWTGLLHDDFGLHPDFIAIAASDDGPDWRDPQGAWYVYWKKDKRVYAVDRDEWHEPKAATSDARAGLNLWPSYVSFVAWWVGQHLQKSG
jgi:hypothetical protein